MAKRRKPRRGRPPLGDDKRSETLRFRARPDEALEIHLAIERAQRKLSDVARELVLDWARRQVGR